MSLADLSVEELLERVAARESAPGGGAVAALTAASAAALVAMAARFSDDAFGDAVARADELCALVSALADEDVAAYGAVLDARRLPRDATDRGARIATALARAADVPLAIAERAREIGELGLRLALHGNPNLRGDAATAVLLVEGAARSAAHLVALNVRAGDLDEDRVKRAAAACAALAEAAQAVEEGT